MAIAIAIHVMVPSYSSRQCKFMCVCMVYQLFCLSSATSYVLKLRVTNLLQPAVLYVRDVRHDSVPHFGKAKDILHVLVL